MDEYFLGGRVFGGPAAKKGAGPKKTARMSGPSIFLRVTYVSANSYLITMILPRVSLSSRYQRYVPEATGWSD
jgi:hypothetical protein